MPLRSKALLALACAAIGLLLDPAAAQAPHNLILFVPDGLRALAVTPQSAPTMAAVRDKGVNFANPHSLFPTFTMPNASGLATGHFLGDTGAFSNTIFTGYPVPSAAGSMTPFIESDPILGDIDAHFSGNFVDEDTVLLTARHQGLSTAAIGKLGPTLVVSGDTRPSEDLARAARAVDVLVHEVYAEGRMAPLPNEAMPGRVSVDWISDRQPAIRIRFMASATSAMMPNRP